MSIYTTPLQFGYILGLSMAMLFWVRGWREERLSDSILGWVMFFLAIEIQDYTFGFAGINYLWNELNGFPRGTALLFGPAVYFYLRAQINRSFSLHQGHLMHLLLWFIPFAAELIIFLMGKEYVESWQSSTIHHLIRIPRLLIVWGSYVYYFSKSLRLYKDYREWAQNQYANQELISFIWFRNLLYFMIIGILFKESMGLIDSFFGLDFYQDWWWNLAMVGIIFYVGILGYAQVQIDKITYQAISTNEAVTTSYSKIEEFSNWKSKIESYMNEEKPYLDQQLNLKSLASQFKTNPSIMSAAINSCFGKNFNDFVNEYRVKEFLNISKQTELAHYTLLALALESGFNSKSTFNRAFKKVTGQTPNEIKR